MKTIGVLLLLFLFAGFQPILAKSVPIVTYHYIGYNPNPGKDPMRDELTTSPQEFEKDLQQIKKSGQTPITLDQFNDDVENPVVLTFDDGYVDFYINAYPLLKKYNFKATQFIPTGFIGDSGYLTWEMIRDMQKSSLISFQSHTATHPNLTYLSYDQILFELKTSKKQLEDKLGEPVNFLAYPYGANNSLVQFAAQQSGYRAALNTWPAPATELNFNMPRIRNLGKSVKP